MKDSGGNFPKLRRRALEFIEYAKDWVRDQELSTFLTMVTGVLRDEQFHSFLLPTNGEIVEFDSPCRIDISDCKLPFEKVILEYQIDRSFYKADADPSKCPEATVLMASQNDRGIEIHPLWFMDDAWSSVPYFLFLGKDSVVEVIESGRVRATNVQTCGFSCDRSGASQDFADELRVLCHFLLIANCANVSVEKYYEPGDAIRKAAQRRHAAAHNSYWILDVFDGRAEKVIGAAGHHSSPRFHVRRGHVRRLPSGGLTWVRQCTVGDADLGVVTKSYRANKVQHAPR